MALPLELHFLRVAGSASQLVTLQLITEIYCRAEDIKDDRIVAVKGVLHSQKFFDEADATKVHFLESITKLIKFVELGRTSNAITGKLNGQYLIHSQNLSNIAAVGKPLFSYPLYHYLHNDYQWLGACRTQH
ncbi:MAG: hypothetical protein V7784_17040 [Oceanospirillaceae bacterium]